MIVDCPNCLRRLGVNLGSAKNREEVSGLQALAQTCPRARINGQDDCGAAKRHAYLKDLLRNDEDQALTL